MVNSDFNMAANLSLANNCALKQIKLSAKISTLSWCIATLVVNERDEICLHFTRAFPLESSGEELVKLRIYIGHDLSKAQWALLKCRR